MTEGPRIYVVDDDEVVLLSVQALLGQHGYQVRCFSSAEQFLAAEPGDCPGCVITDLQMPGMGGLELQRRLVQANSPLSVVVVTGVADVSSLATLQDQGAVTFLEKPYGRGELVEALDRGLAASRARWQQTRP